MPITGQSRITKVYIVWADGVRDDYPALQAWIEDRGIIRWSNGRPVGRIIRNKQLKLSQPLYPGRRPRGLPKIGIHDCHFVI